MQKAIRNKASLLYQFGLSNIDKVRQHLTSKATNQTQLDNTARQMLSDFFNGDRTFCRYDKKYQ